MPHAAVFIVVFQVYVNCFILKSNYNEFDEKPFFLSYKKLAKFQAEKFLISGYLMIQNSGCSLISYKLFSYLRVLTVCELGTTETIL